MLRCYRRFIKDYRSIVKSLIKLLKKGSWNWSPQVDQAFVSLKLTLSLATILALPEFQVEFYIDTDVSNTGVRVVLQQKGHPIAYFNKSIGIKHQSLSIYEKDMLAALLVVKRWHAYLVEHHFYIRTYHQSLNFFQTSKLLPFPIKVVAKMLGYDFQVTYRK